MSKGWTRLEALTILLSMTVLPHCSPRGTVFKTPCVPKPCCQLTHRLSCTSLPWDTVTLITHSGSKYLPRNTLVASTSKENWLFSILVYWICGTKKQTNKQAHLQLLVQSIKETKAVCNVLPLNTQLGLNNYSFSTVIPLKVKSAIAVFKTEHHSVLSENHSLSPV